MACDPPRRVLHKSLGTKIGLSVLLSVVAPQDPQTIMFGCSSPFLMITRGKRSSCTCDASHAKPWRHCKTIFFGQRTQWFVLCILLHMWDFWILSSHSELGSRVTDLDGASALQVSILPGLFWQGFAAICRLLRILRNHTLIIPIPSSWRHVPDSTARQHNKRGVHSQR